MTLGRHEIARARLPEGIDGITRLHALIAETMPASWAELEPAEAASRVRIGIESDRGAWVQALLVAGYQVYAMNPMSVARYRERHSTSGAKSDSDDAHVLAEIVRLDHAHHRQIRCRNGCAGKARRRCARTRTRDPPGTPPAPGCGRPGERPGRSRTAAA